MIKVVRSKSKRGTSFVRALVNRRSSIPKKVERAVLRILEDVKKRGDEALVEYTRRFDCKSLSVDSLKVRDEEVETAYEKVDAGLLEAIRKAVKNVREFHEAQLGSSWFVVREGAVLGQVLVPVDKVGVYVPGGAGGQTPLVSTVVMTAVIAKVAGVREVYMASPPREDGTLHPALLVAARECGVKEVYKMGSAWAIGAFAYGTRTVPKVDVIAGPGNIYVTLAKKVLYGEVGVDLIAGPSEVVIVADDSADPSFVAWDLLAQAEHDELATAVLITPEDSLATKVKTKVKELLEELPRRSIAEAAVRKRGGIIITEDLEEAVELVNAVAPEHLELSVRDPWSLLPKVRSAGAVFLGSYTPEAVGDYMAGPSHVLPTMGAARFSSALSVESFLKRISLISYPKELLVREAPFVVKLAETEGLFAHAKAVEVRIPPSRKEEE